MRNISAAVSTWAADLAFEDLPADVVAATKLRVLDVIGLSIAGGETAFGRSVRSATEALYPGETSRIWGARQRASVLGAAFANGAASQALEYDDTHNESIVHMSSPSVAAALAIADERRLSGRDVIRGVAIGNEISSRVGSIAPGQFHKRGFHPSGLFAPFGISWLAGALYGLKPEQMVLAAGMVGSFAAGLLQCWVDGTQSKFLHPGWAAQSGIAAAALARAGATGPSEVLEGRFGFFASHLQSSDAALNFVRLTEGLGTEWESRNASFKPFPVAHVIHPYIDALLRLRSEHKIAPAEVKRITVPVAAYIVPIVCEPVGEKRRPLTDSHGRVSMQYTLAEALVQGRIGKDAYSKQSLQDPRILEIADLVEFVVDLSFPGPTQFKGAITIDLEDGHRLTTVEEHNRGSRANPMSNDDLIAKFRENVADALPQSRVTQIVDVVLDLDRSKDASDLTALTAPDHG